HAGEFELSVAIGVDGGSNTIWRDELEADAFRRISALDPNGSAGATVEAALHRPLVGLSAIPRVRRRILALHAALFRVKISPQIGDIDIRQSVPISRHAGTAPFDLCADAFVGHWFTRYELLAVIEILQIGTALGVLVVTHPAFVEVNDLATVRAAIGRNRVVIQPERTLQIVDGDEWIGSLNRLHRRGVGGTEPGRRTFGKQSESYGEHQKDWA